MAVYGIGNSQAWARDNPSSVSQASIADWSADHRGDMTELRVRESLGGIVMNISCHGYVYVVLTSVALRYYQVKQVVCEAPYRLLYRLQPLRYTATYGNTSPHPKLLAIALCRLGG